MEYSNQGLTLWYGTSDAPAPIDDVVQPRRANAVVVGVHPADPLNAVTVQYRVDDGPVRAVRAVKFKEDFTRRAQYFRAQLPDFWHGNRVTYLPVPNVASRKTPSADGATALWSCFRLADRRTVILAQSPPAARESRREDERIKFSLDYLATIHVPLKSPEIIGVTPEGIMVNWYWYPAEGVVKGPKLNGKVRQLGGDWMTIRRDGIGVMDVRATLETSDAALIFVDYLGHFDLGKKGYEDFLARRWPERAPTRTAPRFHTSHLEYIWLNRIQAAGIGEVRLKELSYRYDLYALC